MADDRKPPPPPGPPAPPPSDGSEGHASQSDGGERHDNEVTDGSAPSALADARLARLDDGDLLLRTLRELPALPLAASKEARIHARATAQLREAAAHQRRLSGQATSKRAEALARAARRLARPILPLSIAGFALGYLIWTVHTAATFLP